MYRFLKIAVFTEEIDIHLYFVNGFNFKLIILNNNIIF